MRLTRTSRLDSLLSRYEATDLTYPEVGATQGDLPPGYHHTRLRREVGQGDATFRRAADVVMTWNMHRGSGLTVAAAGPAIVGRTVVLAAGAGVGLAIPCRVVYVIDEPRKIGFGYGTLPDHPESGEEAFAVSIDDESRVWLEITAFSRPGSALVKAVAPLALLLQQLALRAYFRSVRRQIAG